MNQLIKSIQCSLCSSRTKLLYKIKNKKYYKCDNCFSVMLDPLDYLSQEEEKERYKNHNNDEIQYYVAIKCAQFKL